ncbi:MAG: outer membrane beta-barrel protein [Planctomycetota bacterium]
MRHAPSAPAAAKLRVIGLLAAAAALAAAPPAAADSFADGMFTPRQGLYVAGSYARTFDYQITGNELAGTSNEREFDLDDGEAYSFAVGTYLGITRIEFETSFFESVYNFTRPTNTVVEGDIEYLSFMGNVYVDLPTGFEPLNLYVGAGAGLSILRSEGSFTPPISFVSGATLASAEETIQVFSLQAMAGLSFEVIEGLHLTSGYRVRWFSENSNNEFGNIGGTFREHTVQSLEAGLRIEF